MRYLSVCSGIEAATVAWHTLGWTPVGFSEIEPFPSAVLAHHYPSVPNLGDMTKFKEWNLESVDLLVGGTPCQSFSVAGLRKGLEDPRGNLALVYCGILDRFKPQWFVWENVPGVLSSSGGRDFGSFLGAVAELGYGFAYRVLDAQYFGVAQRRRRVFVVGCLGDWRAAAEVFFERESLSGNPAPSREAGQEVAAAATAGVGGGGQPSGDVATTVIGNVEGGSATTLSSREYKGLSCGRDGMTSAAVVYEPVYAIQGSMIGRSDNAGPQGNGINEDVCFTQNTTDRHAVVYGEPIPIHDQATRFAGKRGENQDGKGNGLGIGEPGAPMNTLTKGDRHAVAYEAQPVDFRNLCYHEGEVSGTMQAKSSGGYSLNYMTGIQQDMAVRRLTPVECERLQGFPDTYTAIPWRKKEATECPDGPRYKALGNSMAVPVMRWIGERIQLINQRDTK